MIDILAWLLVVITFLFIAWMYQSAVRQLWPPACVTLHSWASVTAVSFLFWGILLIIETFWWFWPNEPVHQAAMGTGGTFGLIWMLTYYIKLRR